VDPALQAALTVKATRPWRIAFIPKFKSLAAAGRLSAFWEPAWEAAAEAGSALGVVVRLETAQNVTGEEAQYVEPQIRLVDDLVTHHEVDGLVVAPFDSNRLAPVLEKAARAALPVIAMDTPVNSGSLLTYVGFDNFAGGREVGEWVAGRLPRGGKALIITGPRDEQNAVDRTNGFLAGLRTADVSVLGVQSADWETDPARTLAEDWLAARPQVDAILAANDLMAIGAARAAAELHRTGIIITGFDATPEGLAEIRAGRMAATVDQQPGEQARLAVRLLVRRLEGKVAYPPVILLPQSPLITAATVGHDRSDGGDG